MNYVQAQEQWLRINGLGRQDTVILAPENEHGNPIPGGPPFVDTPYFEDMMEWVEEEFTILDITATGLVLDDYDGDRWYSVPFYILKAPPRNVLGAYDQSPLLNRKRFCSEGCRLEFLSEHEGYSACWRPPKRGTICDRCGEPI